MLSYICILIFTTLIYIIPPIILIPKKLSYLQTVLFAGITLLSILSLSSFLNNIGVIILLAVQILFLYIVNRTIITNCIIVLFSYILNVILSNVLSVFLCNITGTTLAEFETNLAYMAADFMIHIAISILFCTGLLHLSKRLKNKYIRGAFPKSILAAIGLNLLLTTILFIINIVAGESIGYSHQVILFNTGIFIIYFVLSTISVVWGMHVYLKEKEQEMKDLSYHALTEYTKQVETLYNDLRSFKHDYVNILLTLYEYMDTNDWDNLKLYFEKEILPYHAQLEPHNHYITRLANIQNSEIKSILTTKLMFAAEAGVSVEIEIAEAFEFQNINIVDLSRILGIFLDNAIEGSRETTTPYVKFICVDGESEQVIIVKNSCPAEQNINISDLFKNGVSTKGESRGVGLHTVQNLIAGYSNIYLETEMNSCEFTHILHIYKYS